MSGSSQAPRVYRPYIISSTFAAPVDDKSLISAIANIDTELPDAIRYKGLAFYSEAEENWYYFKTGKATSDIAPISGEIRVLLSNISLQIGENSIDYAVAKNFRNVIINESSNNERVYADWKQGPDNHTIIIYSQIPINVNISIEV